MDIHQLKTFVVVAREGSITRSSEILCLSQPAVSAHIKSMEEGLGLSLFQRTAKGMSLTRDGERLLAKAEQTLAAHQDLLDEAKRNKSQLSGTLRLGAGTNSDNAAVGRLLTGFAARWPGVEVSLRHGTSQEILTGIRNGNLDALFYNHPDDPEPDLTAIEASNFHVFLAAAPGVVPNAAIPDWKTLAERTWIYPASSACCGLTAENLFKVHGFRPSRIVSVDRQDVSKALITSGIGVGLLHADSAIQAKQRGEVELIHEIESPVHVYFAYLAVRRNDPLLKAATEILRTKP